MANTVNAAFAEFMKDVINLNPDDSKGARASRTWLRGQLHTLDDKHSDFPHHYADRDIDYGSFARRTKIRELDDVDLIHCLLADGATYTDHGPYLSITTAARSRLASLCFQESTLLSSTRVLNKFKKHLDEIPQYRTADVKRNGEAVTLELASYSWSFDIVPGFYTVPELDGRTYYVIPNGSGHWMKTDPRLDRDRVSSVNQKHNGLVLDSLRLMKFWNRRPSAPSMPSYAFENMVLDHYASQLVEASQYVDLEVPKVLDHVALAVYSAIQDPKGLQEDLNKLQYDERRKISCRASDDAQKARDAWNFEKVGDHKRAIGKWREVLGPRFPEYDE